MCGISKIYLILRKYLLYRVYSSNHESRDRKATFGLIQMKYFSVECLYCYNNKAIINSEDSRGALPGADPGFPRGGINPKGEWELQPMIGTDFPENYMEMKKTGLGTSPKFYYVYPPLTLACAQLTKFNLMGFFRKVDKI